LTPPTPPQEPDGHNKPTNSTYLAYKTISKLDGYHPISFTPNCQNYFFAQYASGADIVVPDVYPVGNNVSFSTIYNTPCNRTYGCCGAYSPGQRHIHRLTFSGCDNCAGTLDDLATRIKEMMEFTRWTGVHKNFWGVAQAFGGNEFWSRNPTKKEVVQMSKAAVRAGATGMLYWAAPTTQEVWEGTGEVARWVQHGESGTVRDEL
jgi:hypothetical protein